MDPRFQHAALFCLTFIAAVILGLAAWTFWLAISADTPAGTVPMGESSAFMALMLSFREVLGAIKGLAAGQREHVRDQQIFNSAPTGANGSVRAEITNGPGSPVPVTEEGQTE